MPYSPLVRAYSSTVWPDATQTTSFAHPPLPPRRLRPGLPFWVAGSRTTVTSILPAPLPGCAPSAFASETALGISLATSATVRAYTASVPMYFSFGPGWRLGRIQDHTVPPTQVYACRPPPTLPYGPPARLLSAAALGSGHGIFTYRIPAGGTRALRPLRRPTLGPPCCLSAGLTSKELPCGAPLRQGAAQPATSEPPQDPLLFRTPLGSLPTSRYAPQLARELQGPATSQSQLPPFGHTVPAARPVFWRHDGSCPPLRLLWGTCRRPREVSLYPRNAARVSSREAHLQPL